MTGRPDTTFTEEQRESIKEMAGVGIPQKDIAKVIGVDTKTLRKFCKSELDLGSILATAKVGAVLYNQAISGNITACIFWMKARAGWTERHEITGKDGKDLIPALDLNDRVELGKRLAFTLAEAAYNKDLESDAEVKH